MEMLRCILKRAGGVPTRYKHGSHDVPMCVHTRHLLESTDTNTHKQTHTARPDKVRCGITPWRRPPHQFECCSLILSIVVHSSSLSASTSPPKCANTVSQTGGGGEADEGGGVGGDGCDGVRPVMVSRRPRAASSAMAGAARPAQSTILRERLGRRLGHNSLAAANGSQ